MRTHLSRRCFAGGCSRLAEPPPATSPPERRWARALVLFGRRTTVGAEARILVRVRPGSTATRRGAPSRCKAQSPTRPTTMMRLDDRGQRGTMRRSGALAGTRGTLERGRILPGPARRAGHHGDRIPRVLRLSSRKTRSAAAASRCRARRSSGPGPASPAIASLRTPPSSTRPGWSASRRSPSPDGRSRRYTPNRAASWRASRPASPSVRTGAGARTACSCGAWPRAASIQASAPAPIRTSATRSSFSISSRGADCHGAGSGQRLAGYPVDALRAGY